MTVFFSPALSLTFRVHASDGACREHTFSVVLQPGNTFREEHDRRYPSIYRDGGDADARRHFARHLRELADDVERLPIDGREDAA